MATPAGYIDPDDAHYELSSSTSPNDIEIILPFMCPPQARYWAPKGSQSRQQISFNPILHLSNDGVDTSPLIIHVSVGGHYATDTLSAVLDFDYEDFALTTEFQDMSQSPQDDQTILTEVYNGDEKTRMEYRDFKVKFAAGTYDGDDADQLHVVMGGHFELENNAAYTNEDWDVIPTHGDWFTYQEQRPISAWQMRRLLCENWNKVQYTNTPSFSLPFIGKEAYLP